MHGSCQVPVPICLLVDWSCVQGPFSISGAADRIQYYWQPLAVRKMGPCTGPIRKSRGERGGVEESDSYRVPVRATLFLDCG